MSKFTYIASFLIAVTLIIGSLYFSQSFLMSFASTSLGINIARGILAALMLALAFTLPPRSAMLRSLLGMASMGFGMWAISYAMSGSIALGDALLFMHAALSFGIAALEPASFKVIDVEEDNSEERQIEVRLPA